MKKKTVSLMLWSVGAIGVVVGLGFIIKRYNDNKTAKQTSLPQSTALNTKAAMSTYGSWR